MIPHRPSTPEEPVPGSSSFREGTAARANQPEYGYKTEENEEGEEGRGKNLTQSKKRIKQTRAINSKMEARTVFNCTYRTSCSSFANPWPIH